MVTAISFAFSFASSIGRAKLPMVTSAVASPYVILFLMQYLFLEN